MLLKPITIGIVLMIVGLAPPTTAFHPCGGMDPRGGTGCDWTNAVPFLILCESSGPSDPVNPLPTPKMGDGGRCYVSCYGYGAAVPTAAPSPTDVCAIALTVTGGATATSWTVEEGSWTCSTATGGTAYINELYHWWNGAHTAVYNDDPAAPGGSIMITIGATRPTGSLCDGDAATASGPVTL